MPSSPAFSGSHVRPGTRVGEYEIVDLLGHGGMGTVYRGVQPQIGKQVAIKVLNAQVAGVTDAGARFLREAQVVNRIGHPGLVDIFAFGELPNGQHYLIMELLSGESLAARMARGPFSFPELLDIFTQILDALRAAHDHGVVHRDLKPDNIHLSSAGPQTASGLRVKILDFGLAKDLDSDSVTHTGIALGTPRYMAPEQSRGGKYVDRRADLYAVGLMLYEALTGRFPFSAPTPLLMLTQHLTEPPEPPSRFVHLPPALEAVVLRALSKDPKARFQSAAEMAAALRAAGADPATVGIERIPLLHHAPTQHFESFVDDEQPTRADVPAQPGPADQGRLAPAPAAPVPAAPAFEAEETRLSPQREDVGGARPGRPRYLLPVLLGAALACATGVLLLRGSRSKVPAPAPVAVPAPPARAPSAPPPPARETPPATVPPRPDTSRAERPRHDRPRPGKRPARPAGKDVPTPF